MCDPGTSGSHDDPQGDESDDDSEGEESEAGDDDPVIEDNGGEGDSVRPDGLAAPNFDEGEDDPITPTEPEDSPGHDEEWSYLFMFFSNVHSGSPKKTLKGFPHLISAIRTSSARSHTPQLIRHLQLRKAPPVALCNLWSVKLLK